MSNLALKLVGSEAYSSALYGYVLKFSLMTSEGIRALITVAKKDSDIADLLIGGNPGFALRFAKKKADGIEISNNELETMGGIKAKDINEYESVCVTIGLTTPKEK